MLRCYFFLFLLLGFSCLESARAQDAPQAKIIPGRLVFKLKPEYKTAAGNNPARLEVLNKALQSLQATNLIQKFPRAVSPEGIPQAVDLTLVFQVNLPPSQSPEKAASVLRKTGLLEYAEAMRQFDPLYQPNDQYADSTLTVNQYYLKNIRAYRGWDFEKGDTSIVIGISDWGTKYTHKELAPSLKYNYADRIDGIDNDNDGYIDNFRGWDMGDNDNDASDTNGHGIQVTGVSSAKTDNGKGIAGVGFKCKYLPIKIFPSTLSGTFGGFESIVYAADHGCNVINLSWGNVADPSLFEQDVIDYATFNRNVVIVAAAGNTNAKLNFYPASYNNVLSVATLDKLNKKSTGATYSTNVDIASPGVSIITTDKFSDSALYTVAGGSSFAAPMVAGAAALVKKKFPNYKAEQIAEQLRATANPSIYTLPANANYIDMLGKGILDLGKALSATNTKSARIIDIQSNSNHFGTAGDTLSLSLEIKNYLNPLTNLGMTVTSTSPHIIITQGAVTIGPMATLATATATPFKVYIKPTAPVNQKVTFRFTFADGTYSDYQYADLVLNQDFVTIDVNKLAVTVTSKGNIGYQNFDQSQGKGIVYRHHSLISEGGLLIGNAPTAVSDNVRNGTLTPDRDFFTQARIHYVNSVIANMEAEGMMADSFPAAGMVGVGVKYRAYAWQNAPNDKFVILEYKIRNLRTTTLTNLYAGMFADWDIFNSTMNGAGYDTTTRTGYVFHVRQDTLFAAIKLLSNFPPSFHALDYSNPPASSINVADGFTDAEKFQALSGGVSRIAAGTSPFGNDVSYVIGSKLPDLAPNDTVTVAFAVLVGDDLIDLFANAHVAQTAYTSGPLGQRENITYSGKLTVFPNPASSVLHVKLPETGPGIFQLELLDALGRTLDRKSGKNNETVSFNVENLPAGLYFLKAESNKNRQILKVQVLK